MKTTSELIWNNFIILPKKKDATQNEEVSSCSYFRIQKTTLMYKTQRSGNIQQQLMYPKKIKNKKHPKHNPSGKNSTQTSTTATKEK
jgi:hypothetical protein